MSLLIVCMSFSVLCTDWTKEKNAHQTVPVKFHWATANYKEHKSFRLYFGYTCARSRETYDSRFFLDPYIWERLVKIMHIFVTWLIWTTVKLQQGCLLNAVKLQIFLYQIYHVWSQLEHHANNVHVYSE